MRVISGSARGLKLSAPKGIDTRPTTDRMKETLFNILAPDIYDCRFLDLFSGSGSIGIEGLSRGASFCVFVDNSDDAIDIIKKNITAAKVLDKSKIIKTKADLALDLLYSEGLTFDIIFIDPPYDSSLYEAVLEKIVSLKILSENGYVVLERRAGTPAPQTQGLKIFREKPFNKTTVMTFLNLEDNQK